MPKTKISEYSATAANNTDINSIDIGEGCAPSGINDAIRTLMKQIKDLQAGTSGDTIPVAAGGTGATTASAARIALLPSLTGNGSKVLAVNSGASDIEYINAATGDVTTTGSQTLTNKTISGSSNTISNIGLTNQVTGTLPIANGGTGLSSVGTNGQVIQSNGSALVFATPATTAPAGSTGQVQYNNAGAFGAVSAGTSGQVLTSAGSGAVPTWSNPSAGAMVYLSTVTASGASTASIESGFSSTYDDYIIIADNIYPTDTGTYLYAQTKIGSSYLTSSYKYNLYYMDTANASGYWEVASGGITNGVKLAYRLDNNDNGPTSFYDFRMNLQGVNSSVRQAISTHLYGYSSADRGRSNFSVGLSEASNGALTGIKILISAGTFSGTFKLYGIVKS
jgi:hypothetical protein